MIERLNARDKQAFEYVFIQFYNSLCYFADKYVCDKTAQDIVQEVFIWFYEKRNSFDSLLAVKSYLYGSVYNKAINFLKTSRNQAIIREKMKTFLSEEDDSYEEIQIETEVFEEIFQAIEELPTECGRIFKMSYIEGKSIKSIMKTLNITESTIKTQRQRAKKILKDKLKHLYPLAIAIFSIN
ncbi:MAG: RNA polymerase sigma factor [Butyricimonas faecihominis]